MLAVGIIISAAFGLFYLLAIAADKQTKGDADRKEARLNTILALPDFKADATYLSPSSRYLLAIDVSGSLIAVSMLDEPVRVLQFDDLVASELDINGNTVTRTEGKITATGAAVATALAGPIGMALGAKTKTTSVTTNQVSAIELRLLTNDILEPVITIPFYEFGAPLPADHKFVVDAKSDAERWYGRFRAILSGADSRR